MEQSAESFEAVQSRPVQEQLPHLRRHVVLVGNLVLLQFQEACEGLRDESVSLSAQIAKRQVDIGLLVGDGEELVLDYLRQEGSQEPHDSELRTAVASGQILREYELVAREAVSLASAVAVLGALQGPRALGQELRRDIGDMRSTASRLLHVSLEVLSNSDPASALSVSRGQTLFPKGVALGLRRLVAFAALEEGSPTVGVALEGVFRSLEKVGEHAKKVCEYVAYTEHGKLRKHSAVAQSCASSSETGTRNYGPASSGYVL